MQAHLLYHERLEPRTGPLRAGLQALQFNLGYHPILQHRRTSLLRKVDALPSGPRVMCIWTHSAVFEALLALVVSIERGVPTHSVVLVSVEGGVLPHSPLVIVGRCDEVAQRLTTSGLQPAWSNHDGASARATIQVDWHNAGHLLNPDNTHGIEKGRSKNLDLSSMPVLLRWCGPSLGMNKFRNSIPRITVSRMSRVGLRQL